MWMSSVLVDIVFNLCYSVCMDGDNTMKRHYHTSSTGGTMKRKIPEILTASEQEALLAQPNPRYLTGQRNQTMLRLMLDTGLRLDEASSLKWSSIDLMAHEIRVRDGAKGGKHRNLWPNDEAIEALKSWRKRQTGECEGNPQLVFTTKQGTKLLPSYVRSMVVRYGKKAGITKQIGPHTLRHSFASDIYRQTGSLKVTQEALGHSDMQTTTIYLHTVNGEVKAAMRSLTRTPSQ